MITNYFLTGLRTLKQNKLYSFINIFGLTLGLTFYLFAHVFADYERNYDSFFKNSNNIYVPYILFKSGGPMGSGIGPNIPTAAKTLLEGVEGVEKIAWSISKTFVTQIDEQKFEQKIRFLDNSFFDIFDFKFLYGKEKNALIDANSIIINESTAIKYFGSVNPIGKTIRINENHDFIVRAVFQDLPKNSHFTNSLVGFSGFEFAASIESLKQVSSFDTSGDWSSMSADDMTYILLSDNISQEQISNQLDKRYQELVPDRMKEVFNGIKMRHISELNLFIWEASGVPALTVMEILGFLILALVILNYTNLAYAIAINRAREVGLRKTLGAKQKDILIQFMVEAFLICIVAGFCALVVIDIVAPILNDLLNRNIEFSLVGQENYLIFFACVIILTSIATGFYPATFLTRISIVEILSGSNKSSAKFSWRKKALLVFQFIFAVIFISFTFIIAFQNKKLEEASYRFDRDNIVNIYQMRPEMRDGYDVLRRELLNISGISHVSGTSQIPFQQKQVMRSLGITRSKEDEKMVQQFDVEESFLQLHSVELLAGRMLSRERNDGINNSQINNGSTKPIPVIINEMAMRQFGWGNFDIAIGNSIYSPETSEHNSEFEIVGIVKDRNFSNIFNAPAPIVFMLNPELFELISLKIDGDNYSNLVKDIERVWKTVYSDIPLTLKSLNVEFDESYGLLKGVNIGIALVAGIIVIFSLIGLFGLVAFLIEGKNKEIAIRKVLGANSVTLLGSFLWVFFKPILAAIAIGTPISFLVAQQYLNLFSDRIDAGILFFIPPILLLLLLSALIISFHIVKISRKNPIYSLRYE